MNPKELTSLLTQTGEGAKDLHKKSSEGLAALKQAIEKLEPAEKEKFAKILVQIETALNTGNEALANKVKKELEDMIK